MEFERLGLDGVVLVRPRVLADERGWFCETFRLDRFRAAVGLPDVEFVQDNQSASKRRGTVRGLHFQRAPRAQGKLVRCVRGRILDVAVDVRHGSTGYGRHVAVELSAENWQQLWVPAGFLHGFCTLTDDAEVAYKVTDVYSGDHDAGVRWNDPALGIDWPVAPEQAIVSEKDGHAPLLAELGPLF